MTKADIEKTAWSGKVVSVQPRIRLMRSLSYLMMAAEKHNRLGRYFSRYGITATMSLPITDEMSAHVGPKYPGRAARPGGGLPAPGTMAERNRLL